MLVVVHMQDFNSTSNSQNIRWYCMLYLSSSFCYLVSSPFSFYQGIEVGDKPQMNMKVWTTIHLVARLRFWIEWRDTYKGNALTDRYINSNARIKYAHRMGLISNKIYQVTNSLCTVLLTSSVVQLEITYNSLWFCN